MPTPIFAPPGAASPRGRLGAGARLSRALGASTLAALLVGALSTAPASANVADGVNIASSTVNPNADGTVTVTFAGTWQWTSLHPTVNKPCDRRIGVGYAFDWNDPGDPGYSVTFKHGRHGGEATLGMGATGSDGLNPPEQVLWDPSDPCGTFVQTGADGGTGGYAQGNWSDQHLYQNMGAVPPVICVVFYDLGFPPGPNPKRLLVTNTDTSVGTALKVNPGWTPTPGNGLCIVPGVVTGPVTVATVATTTTTAAPPAPTTTTSPPVSKPSGALAYTGPGQGMTLLAATGALASAAGVTLLVAVRRRSSLAGLMRR